jgi:8-oxo-dGTP pyrophosphatase MutT (NUDIX family)
MSKKNREVVNVIISDSTGKYTLLLFKKGKLILPGGKKEIYDKNLLDCLRRECDEEIGLNLLNFDSIDTNKYSFYPNLDTISSAKKIDISVYYGKLNEGCCVKTSNEIDGFVWVDLNNCWLGISSVLSSATKHILMDYLENKVD